MWQDAASILVAFLFVAVSVGYVALFVRWFVASRRIFCQERERIAADQEKERQDREWLNSLRVDDHIEYNGWHAVIVEAYEGHRVAAKLPGPAGQPVMIIMPWMREYTIVLSRKGPW